MSTLSCRSSSRRHDPSWLRTNTAICLTKRAGEGIENSVMIAHFSPTRPRFGASCRATPHSRSQMSTASTPPGRRACGRGDKRPVDRLLVWQVAEGMAHSDNGVAGRNLIVGKDQFGELLDVGGCFVGERQHGWRCIGCDHPMAGISEMASEQPTTAAELHNQPVPFKDRPRGVSGCLAPPCRREIRTRHDGPTQDLDGNSYA